MKPPENENGKQTYFRVRRLNPIFRRIKSVYASSLSSAQRFTGTIRTELIRLLIRSVKLHFTAHLSCHGGPRIGAARQFTYKNVTIPPSLCQCLCFRPPKRRPPGNLRSGAQVPASNRGAHRLRPTRARNMPWGSSKTNTIPSTMATATFTAVYPVCTARYSWSVTM